MINTETTMIRATSRCSIKVRDTFYTVEYCEERAVHIDPTMEKGAVEDELQKEREKLWDTVNEECDNQIEDILKTAY